MICLSTSSQVATKAALVGPKTRTSMESTLEEKLVNLPASYVPVINAFGDGPPTVRLFKLPDVDIPGAIATARN